MKQFYDGAIYLKERKEERKKIYLEHTIKMENQGSNF